LFGSEDRRRTALLLRIALSAHATNPPTITPSASAIFRRMFALGSCSPWPVRHRRGYAPSANFAKPFSFV
jgi:hypothetical protein